MQFPHTTDVKLACRRGEKADYTHLFRTYYHPYDNQYELNSGEPKKISIWKVARATSAAPLYFREPKIEDDILMDGGLVENNPSIAAMTELSPYELPGGGKPPRYSS